MITPLTFKNIHFKLSEIFQMNVFAHLAEEEKKMSRHLALIKTQCDIFPPISGHLISLYHAGFFI